MSNQLPSLVPELIVKDIERSLIFYCQMLGGRVVFERTDDRFSAIELYGGLLMLEQLDEASHEVSLNQVRLSD